MYKNSQENTLIFLNFYLFFFISFFIFFYFTISYWFCHTSTWIRHRHTCVPHPEPPSHTSFPIASLRVIPVHQPHEQFFLSTVDI